MGNSIIKLAHCFKTILQRNTIVYQLQRQGKVSPFFKTNSPKKVNNQKATNSIIRRVSFSGDYVFLPVRSRKKQSRHQIHDTVSQDHLIFVLACLYRNQEKCLNRNDFRCTAIEWSLYVNTSAYVVANSSLHRKTFRIGRIANSTKLFPSIWLYIRGETR